MIAIHFYARSRFYWVLLAVTLSVFSQDGFGQKNKEHVFLNKQLAAWCIVPFDAKNRTPEERAEMLDKLGIRKLAYDWRDEHIPLFDREWAALKQHNIALFAFWLPSNADPAKNPHIEKVFKFLERNQIKTQLWYLPGWFDGFENQVPGFKDMPRSEQIATIAKPVRYIAERAEKLGCTVGLYNHGGWFGEPENQIAIIEYLKMKNVGMVYNFHHAREQIDRFSEFYPKMEPHLLAVNFAGLQSGPPAKVVPLGTGDAEYAMISQILKSKYKGPVSVQNHHPDKDAEVALIAEREGLKQILQKINPMIIS